MVVDEKENCVELMVVLVACDRSSNQPGEKGRRSQNI